MARSLRIEFPDALYHITSRGNEGRDIFRDDVDRAMYLTFLGQAIKRFGWSLSAWVLMTNHYHLVLQTRKANLSRGMHWLNGTYAGWFNRRHKRSGHLFQGRFHSFLVEKQSYFREVLRYVVLNPVRAKMVDRPEDYVWSSYRSMAGLEAPPAWLDTRAVLQLFDDDPEVAQRVYQAFVAARIDSSECLWDQAINGIYLGTESWAKQMRAVVEAKPRSTDHPRKQRAIGRPKMAQIVAAVADAAATNAATIREMRGGPLRRLVAWIGWNEGLATLRTIAASLRLRSEGHISGMIRRCERELAHDPESLRHLDRALALSRA
jgi:putative transposase